MADWSEFFYGVVAGSAVTIIGMSAATYVIWLAFVAGISGHAHPPVSGDGPWNG